MELTKAARKRAADWLALIHATGYKPSGLHIGTSFATTVLLGYSFDVHTARFSVKPEALPLLEGHRLLASVDALRAQGFRVDTGRISRLRRWTPSRGVPMCHTEDLRTVTVDVDGCARQLTGPDGHWQYKELGNPGRERR